MSTLFQKLFICDVANNHQGSVEHGLRIVDAMADVAERTGVRMGVKFQFRELDSFIHPHFADRKDVKHIERFQSTRLSPEEFSTLVARVKDRNLIAVSTPYDEASVQQCLDMDIDILKIASCSAQDWPLIETVAATGKPVIVSSGGLTLPQIDKVVSFLRHRKISFALMHCVGIYPTPNASLHMETVARFRLRYPGASIGYSGHEAPENTEAAIVAVSKGAELLERHVGLEDGEITLNAYSMNPRQTEEWIRAALRGWEIGGNDQKKVSEEEMQSLKTLMRGAYLSRPMRKGQKIGREDIYFAMPLQENQVTSGAFGNYRAEYIASRDYEADEPLIETAQTHPVDLARDVIHEAKAMLNEANIWIGEESAIELSHHYGLEKFREIGATIINMVNREYCKKIIIMLPGQTHPLHRHERKEETFELLSGDLEVHLDGEVISLERGDRLLVKRATWHGFTTKNGAIFEEISTTHYRDDSFYKDESISALDPMQRKTIIDEAGNL